MALSFSFFSCVHGPFYSFCEFNLMCDNAYGVVLMNKGVSYGVGRTSGAMSRHQPERSIPHLRDIFGFHGIKGGEADGEADAAQLSSQLKEVVRLRGGGKKSSGGGGGNDSAVGGSSDEEDGEERKAKEQQHASSKKKKKGGSGGGERAASKRDRTRTLTERDVRHLERHLSMKKTIRKKIMRDLQSAFLVEESEPRLSPSVKQTQPEPSLLDMLRAEDDGITQNGKILNDDRDSGHESPTRETSNVRHSDFQSSCDKGLDEDPDDEDAPYADVRSEVKKTSFWRRFTMKGRNKR
ncbi:uncharacterized protein LOC124166900 isoform X2 [Ischnura elegans]|uniref:uncharacterized protein LOC124166900 isoform X2 n=1 Tax=Ischnura elegans TaxID=197161 RepID=UPI001ED8795A|nr:uncharacterized protein LOC124166900 isoform X2 [Ischnura elegans]